jgi:hypothetical protein
VASIRVGKASSEHTYTRATVVGMGVVVLVVMRGDVVGGGVEVVVGATYATSSCIDPGVGD